MPPARLPSLVIAAIALACAGCETFSPAQTCDMSPQDNPAATYSGGVVCDHVYTSSPMCGPDGSPVGPPECTPVTAPADAHWCGPLLLFKGGAQYTLEHHLGATPQWLQLWVAFTSEGAGGGGTIAQAAGNEVQVERVDATTIKVANFSCSDYYLLVVAGAGGTTAPP